MKTQQIIMAAAICVLCGIAMVTAVLGQGELQNTQNNQTAAIVEVNNTTTPITESQISSSTEVSTSSEAIDSTVSSTTYDTQGTDTIPQ